MAATPTQISAQMIAQLRMLDPSVSAEVGTPERKIIDTVAQGLSDAQIDLEGLATALDIDSKYGSALDRFFSIFGFARQKAAFAKGYVYLGRVTASNADTRIPMNTRCRSYIETADATTTVEFATVYDVILPAGETEVLVPVQCLVAGTIGNVAAYDITEIAGTSSSGITEVFNDQPTAGGVDQEDDDQFKVRFKNTVFRNLAGTRDQYLALAISTAYSTKANVVGPQSTYREYIQVPTTADNAGGNGSAGEFTTALSTIPFAKEIWNNVPTFISDGTSVGAHFYRQGVDFDVNYIGSSRNRGDAYRLFLAYPDIEVNPATAGVKPNITFKNIYTGPNILIDAIRPDDLVLLEYTYLSKASRNSLAHNVTNAVDVFVDGGNAVTATTVTSRPTSGQTFVDNEFSVYHIENYRRIGNAERRPDIGNVLVPLYWQPVMDIPDIIIVNDVTYYKDIHYWAVTDVSEIGGTFRSRSGIEFSNKERGQRTGDAGDIEAFTGPLIVDASEDDLETTAMEITGYTYDKNIADLQVALEAAKQVTTDVLAHKAKFRYLKCDFAVMYSRGVAEDAVNDQISASINTYLRGLFFGSVVQLSDIVQVAHSVSGVDNIRWSSDLPDRPDDTRIYQTDSNGIPLTNVTIDRVQRGRTLVSPEGAAPIPARAEIQHLFITGEPKSGHFVIQSPTNSSLSATINVNQSNANVVSALNAFSATLPADEKFTATVLTRSGIGSEVSVRAFKLEYNTNGSKTAPVIYSVTLEGGPYIIKNDFFINDDEIVALADEKFSPIVGVSDSAPGVIARPRAQGTWIKS